MVLSRAHKLATDFCQVYFGPLQTVHFRGFALEREQNGVNDNGIVYTLSTRLT